MPWLSGITLNLQTSTNFKMYIQKLEIYVMVYLISLILLSTTIWFYKIKTENSLFQAITFWSFLSF
jgi:hypothetical protein